MLDLQGLHRDWYAWTMQGGLKPDFLKERVAYYVMGGERWRYAATLEAVTSRYEEYFLDSDGQASDVYCSGLMGAPMGSGPPDSYRYDPTDVSGPEVAAEADAGGASLVDQGAAHALRGKQLVYHTRPFADATEISGFFSFSAWIAIDTPDTDFFVSVHEIDGQGASIRLSTDALRARYREGLREAHPVQTLSPIRYDFERFTFIARRIERGHRLRLIIAPLGRLIESTFVQKNYQGGGIVSAETVVDARAVTVRLFHDPDHPSVLRVPIGAGETSRLAARAR
jgi:hypothetical protein